MIHESSKGLLYYFYQYIFFIVAALLAAQLGAVYALIPLGLMLLFVIDALMMTYELSEDELYLSPSLFERESITVKLKDVKSFYVIDQSPWKQFGLGTILLISDFEEAAHPCIKCVNKPHQLANKIKRQAIKQGAHL